MTKGPWMRISGGDAQFFAGAERRGVALAFNPNAPRPISNWPPSVHALIYCKDKEDENLMTGAPLVLSALKMATDELERAPMLGADNSILVHCALYRRIVAEIPAHGCLLQHVQKEEECAKTDAQRAEEAAARERVRDAAPELARVLNAILLDLDSAECWGDEHWSTLRELRAEAEEILRKAGA